MDNESQKGQMALFESPGEKVQEEKEKKKGKAAPGKSKEEKAAKETGRKAAVAASKEKVAGKGGKKPSRGLSGLVPEGDVRLTANIREDLHLKLKIAAAHQRTTIGEIIESLVEKYIK